MPILKASTKKDLCKFYCQHGQCDIEIKFGITCPMAHNWRDLVNANRDPDQIQPHPQTVIQDLKKQVEELNV